MPLSSAPGTRPSGRMFAACERWSIGTRISGALRRNRCWPTSRPIWSAPYVKFHSSKLNYKWAGSGEIVKWHQDIPAWPHTNYSPVTLGIYLCDVPAEQGPLTCIAGSHRGPIFEHRDESGAWIGAIRDSDIEALDTTSAEDLTGPAGTVIAINCRTVHASHTRVTDRVQPVALFVYSSADPFAW